MAKKLSKQQGPPKVNTKLSQTSAQTQTKKMDRASNDSATEKDYVSSKEEGAAH
jgi:hypothetical protein